MKRTLLAAFALTIAFSSPSHALNYGPTEIAGVRYSENSGWRYHYDISAVEDVVKVDVGIRLVGDTPAAETLQQWESGIESTWSTDRFAVPIVFNVNWMQDTGYTVNVGSGDGQWDMLHWYTGGTGDITKAAHQFGHMLGLFDQYPNGEIDPATELLTNGIMGSGTEMLDSYYEPFLTWYDDPVPTPEPGTVALLVVGMAAVLLFKRKQIV